jgi:hypothetical protein
MAARSIDPNGPKAGVCLLGVRMSPRQKKALDKIAKRNKLSTSEYVRRLLADVITLDDETAADTTTRRKAS